MSFCEIFHSRNVLITGHTGFKGSWLTAWLKELGSQVTGVALDPPTKPSHFLAARLGEGIQDLRVDLRDQKTLKEVIRTVQPEFVFHLAAQPLVRQSYSNPVDTYATNVMGTLHLLEALREVKQSCVAVLITSDKCYDNVEWVWGYRETDRLGGPDPYSASKGAAELVIRSHVHSFFPKQGNVRIGVGRAGNVIGGGDWAEDRIVPDCVQAWSQGEQALLRNPRATRPWQHVLEPLCGYLNLAMSLSESAELHGEPFNFGPPADQNHSVGNLVTQMSEHWDRVRWQDVSQGGEGPYESGLLKLNCDKALHHLKWRAIWNFEQTVKATVEWYRSFYEQPQSILELTNRQISCYQEDARELGLEWAQ
jgi:CDP-glucose 4,6-dehydratase